MENKVKNEAAAEAKKQRLEADKVDALRAKAALWAGMVAQFTAALQAGEAEVAAGGDAARGIIADTVIKWYNAPDLKKIAVMHKCAGVVANTKKGDVVPHVKRLLLKGATAPAAEEEDGGAVDGQTAEDDEVEEEEDEEVDDRRVDSVDNQF
eukprot:1972200-Rhodomonas_salina.1